MILDVCFLNFPPIYLSIVSRWGKSNSKLDIVEQYQALYLYLYTLALWLNPQTWCKVVFIALSIQHMPYHKQVGDEKRDEFLRI